MLCSKVGYNDRVNELKNCYDINYIHRIIVLDLEVTPDTFITNFSNFVKNKIDYLHVENAFVKM